MSDADGEPGDLGGPYVCHASELPFVFHAMGFCGEKQIKSEMDLSTAMMTYWTQFASGNLDGKHDLQGLPSWPRFNNNTLLSMGLVTPSPYVISEFNKERCDFWDAMGYNW